MAHSRGGPTRRTLVRGAAWSVPVAAAATAAPAFAASPVPCPAFPTAGYTESTTGPLNTAPRRFVGGAYQMNTDANSTTSSSSVTITSPVISVVAATTYNLSVRIQTQYGVNVSGNGPAGTRNTNFTASVFGNIAGGTVTLGPYSTQTSGGGTVVTPVNGGLSTGITVNFPFTATSTGTVQVRYAFTMTATNAGNNDDYLITTGFASCTR